MTHVPDALRTLVQTSRAVAIVPHVHPDPDALSSSFALKLLCDRLDVPSRVLFDESVSHGWLPLIHRGEQHDLTSFDAVVAVDCADAARMGAHADLLTRMPSAVIDHHATNAGFADVNVIDAAAASTTQIIHDVAVAWDIPLDTALASNIYTGLVADTGGFRYSNTNSSTHLLGAELLRYGFDHTVICNTLFSSRTLGQLRLMGLLTSKLELHYDGRLALCDLTLDDIYYAGASDADASELSYLPRSVEGVELSIYLRERSEDDGARTYVKASLRSKSYADVAALAVRFGGGGHVRAAGCEMHMTMDEARAAMLAAVNELQIFEANLELE